MRVINYSKFVVVCFLSLGHLSLAVAGNYTWDCISNNNWDNSACWDLSATPTSTDVVYIGSAYSALTGSSLVTIDSTTNASVASLYVDNSGSYSANLNQTGGSLNVLSIREYIGYWGTGSFVQSGGTHTVAEDLSIGRNVGSNGSYTLSGSGSLIANSETIGDFGAGSFAQSGGTNSAGAVYLGFGTVASGSYALSGLGNLAAGSEYIGFAGVGSFTQNGGTHSVTNDFNLGYGTAGSSGNYNLNAGVLAVGSETIGYYGAGSITQGGGTHTVTNDLLLGEVSGSSGVYNLNGGHLTVGGNIVNGSGTSTLNINGGTLTVGGGNGNIDVDNFNIGNAVADPGAVPPVSYTQSGGTTTVENTLALGYGTYNLNGGILIANTIDIPDGLNQFNFTGGTLAAGTVVGNLVNHGGTVAPGASPGTTHITGDYTQQTGGTLDIQIGGLLAGSEFDVLNVDGTANLGGTLNVDWYDLGGGLFNASAGDSFDILSADIITGQFDTLSLASLGNGLSWNVNYLFDPTGTDYLQLSVVSTVPLPASVWLFASGLLGLVGMARRKTVC